MNSPTEATSETPLAAVIVLAAGEGKRMKSVRPKFLHPVGGRSILHRVLDAATALAPEHVAVVVGTGRDQVEAHLDEVAPHAVRVPQGDEAYGTGYAAQCALAGLPELHGDVVITVGDAPLQTGDALAELVATHRAAKAVATILTATAPDPTGYGRIVRAADGSVTAIVEHKDATDEQRAIDEINSGIFVFDAEVLRDGLSKISTDNAQGELMLTDVIKIATDNHRPVAAHRVDDFWLTEGVNDRVQLGRLNTELNRRICESWMRAGVTIVDPATTWIHDTVDLATDVTLLPGTTLEGATSIGEGATIGPDTTLADVEIGAGATVIRTHGSLAVIGADATVGPFAYLRPGTELGTKGKIGTFVETKNAIIGAGAKVPHLTYAGDTTIGEGANIGAGTIFANYDGVLKTSSTVGRHSFVGSGTVLVHPREIADGTYVAAGSTITADVEPGELAVARGRQRNIPGWVARKRAGTRTAAAAEQAAADQTQGENSEQEQGKGDR